MQETDLLQMALGLFPPWLVEGCTFDPDQKQLDIYIDFSRGRRLCLPELHRAHGNRRRHDRHGQQRKVIR